MKIVYFGTSSFTPLVLPYLEKSFEVELVVNENNFESGKIKNTQSEVAVLAAFGKILPKDILDHFKYGIFNIHPSLLPKYRGASPVQSAILNGDSQTGVTIIKLDEEMDHGPILAQAKIAITENDTAQSLYEKLFPLGAKLLIEALPSYISGEKQLTEQNHSDATYTKVLTRDDGFIDILSVEPDKFERMVRAYFPWPGVWTKAILNTNSEQKIIKFLPNKKIQVEGKGEMSYKDFINGYPSADKNLLEFLKKITN
jgi:methionyl-tRNA formyltransferase